MKDRSPVSKGLAQFIYFFLAKVTCHVTSIYSIAIIQQYVERRKKLMLASDPSSFPPKGLTILEAFSASGLRSIRYAKEIVSLDQASEKLIERILANDISKRAVERIQFNIDKNEVGDIVKANHAGWSLILDF